MSLKDDDELSARSATHPRVSVKDLEANIVSENYFTAGQAARGLNQPHSEALDLLTIYVGVTKNGFTIVGKSAPASPENFDEHKGQVFAKEDALRQLWPLMGYALRERLASGG